MSSQPIYYLYIDDSGSRFPDKKSDLIRRDGMDHFALGGVLVEENDREFILKEYKSFISDWGLSYPLHSSEIRSMRDNFIWLESSAKQREKFLQELEVFLLKLPVVGFAAVVHRPGYNARYKEKYAGKPWWMCKTAYAILIERATRYVQARGGKLKIRFEEAGKKEDRAITEYTKMLKTTGMPFANDTSAQYHGLLPEDFRTVIFGQAERKKKENVYMQIADLYLYPMAKRKYEPTYNPWVKFFEEGKVIDSLLTPEDFAHLGIKYSCFDGWENKKPGKSQA